MAECGKWKNLDIGFVEESGGVKIVKFKGLMLRRGEYMMHLKGKEIVSNELEENKEKPNNSDVLWYQEGRDWTFDVV